MPVSHTNYSSPLAERYASPAMLELWGAQNRYGLWRRLWLALAEGEKRLGVDIPDAAINEMRAALDNIDFAAVADYEKRFRHDVMAHVHAFGDAAPSAKAYIHLGATSAFVTDNADLILMRRGLEILRAKLAASLRAMAMFARDWRSDRVLRRLEALLLVADKDITFLVSGTGDLIEPDDGIAGIGSGSVAAMGAARALVAHSTLKAADVAREALLIAASLDIYTNDNIAVECLPQPGAEA